MHFLAVWPSWCLEDAFGVRRFSYSHLSAMVVKGFAFNSISLSHAHCEECGYPPMLTWKDEWVNIIGIQRTPQNTEGSNYVTNCMTKLCCILMVENCGGTDTTNLQAAESQLDRITASNYYSKEDHHFVWIICNIQGIFSNPITSPSIVCRAVLTKSLLWFSNDESRGTKYLHYQLAPGFLLQQYFLFHWLRQSEIRLWCPGFPNDQSEFNDVWSNGSNKVYLKHSGSASSKLFSPFLR